MTDVTTPEKQATVNTGATTTPTPRRLPYNMQNVRGTGDLPDDGPVQSPVYDVLIVNAKFWQTVLSIARVTAYKTLQPTHHSPSHPGTPGRAIHPDETHVVGTHGSRRGSLSPLGDEMGGDHSGLHPGDYSHISGVSSAAAPLTQINMDALNREGNRASGGGQETHHDFLVHAMGTGTLSHVALATVLTEQGIPCSDVLASSLIRRVAGGKHRLTEQQFNVLMTSVHAAVVRTIAATNLRCIGDGASKYRGNTPTEVTRAAQKQQRDQSSTPRHTGGQEAPSPGRHQHNTPRRSQSPTASTFSPSYRQANLLSAQRMAEAPVFPKPVRGRNEERPWNQPVVSQRTALEGGKRRSTTPVRTSNVKYYRSDAYGNVGGQAALITAAPGGDLGAHNNLAQNHRMNIEAKRAASSAAGKRHWGTSSTASATPSDIHLRKWSAQVPGVSPVKVSSLPPSHR